MNRARPARYFLPAARVAVDPQAPPSLLLRIDDPTRLPLVVSTSREALALLALEALGASPRRRRDLVLDFLLGRVAAPEFFHADAAANAAWRETEYLAGAFMVLGPLPRRGLAVYGGRLHLSASAGLGSGRQWPPRSTASRRRSP